MSPLLPGPNQIVMVLGAAGPVLSGAQVEVLATMPGMSMHLLRTMARDEPAIYEVGAYPDQPRRLSALATAAMGEHIDYVAEGLRCA
jgi:hypothetical protein